MNLQSISSRWADRSVSVDESELAILNFYRASELCGGLVLGRMAIRVRDPGLVLDLTRHSAESLLHAQLWTETILAVGGEPHPIRDTYQHRFSEFAGKAPPTLLHTLVATQVLERRAYRHFLEHLRRPGTHRRVMSTLYRMIEEERRHLAWIKEWLDRRVEEGETGVERILQRYTAAEAELYPELLQEYGWVQTD